MNLALMLCAVGIHRETSKVYGRYEMDGYFHDAYEHQTCQRCGALLGRRPIAEQVKARDW